LAIYFTYGNVSFHVTLSIHLTQIEKDTCNPLFIAALFTTVEHGSNLGVHQQMNG